MKKNERLEIKAILIAAVLTLMLFGLIGTAVYYLITMP